MPRIIVLDQQNNGIGQGDGTIDVHAKTANINNWIKKPGLDIGHNYKLKSQGTTYSARFASRSANPPVATFDNVQ